MTTSSSEATIGGFTDADIEDVTKTVLSKLTDGAGRPIEWTKLTDAQKAGFVDAARKSITGERTTGFASFFNDDARPADKRTEKEREEFAANETAAQHLETEFSKLTWNEFDKRRNSQ
jgi:hypothetical protein